MVGHVGTLICLPADTEGCHQDAWRPDASCCKSRSILALQQEADNLFLQAYAQYHPYEFLAYWFELQQAYEKVFGPFYKLDPTDYPRFTGTTSQHLVCRHP